MLQKRSIDLKNTCYFNFFRFSPSNFGWISVVIFSYVFFNKSVTNFSGCRTLEWQKKHQLPYWPNPQVLQKQRAWHHLRSNPGLHPTQSKAEADNEGSHFKTEGSDSYFAWLSNTKTLSPLVGWTWDPICGSYLISVWLFLVVSPVSLTLYQCAKKNRF